MPRTRYLKSKETPTRSGNDFRITLELRGKTHTVDLIKDKKEAARRQGGAVGNATFSHREIYGMKHAAGDEPLPSDMVEAILDVKGILGGTIMRMRVKG
jgi:hypothetical protein